jgi:alpha-N-arabinofuranosidase
MSKIIIKTQDGDVKISRHIYGHFSEHLGRCIYGAYWVGNDPEAAKAIPNTRGIRNDVVVALKKIKIHN